MCIVYVLPCTICWSVLLPCTLQVSHLVVSNVSKCEDSHKVQMAVKYGIPVVSLSFLDTCVAQGKLVDADSFVVAGKTAADEFRTGKIVGEQGCS